MHELIQTFMFGRGSIIQLVQHSPDLAAEFEKSVRAAGGTVKNLRGAKHRFESYAMPAWRFSMHNNALCHVASFILARRQNASLRAKANLFLTSLNEETRLLMAFIADFAQDCLQFTRWLDDEDVDSSTIYDSCAALAKQLLVLYQEGTFTQVGCTQAAISSLTRVRLLTLSDGSVKSIGGVAETNQDALSKCQGKAKCIAKVALQILATQFPNFDLFASFSLFSLAEKQQKNKPDIQNKRTDEQLCKLALFFAVEKDLLKEQHHDILPIAQRAFIDKSCTIKEAWRSAISRVHARKTMENSDSELLQVLMRHAVYGASTSGVEQMFSKFKQLYGEHRLGGHEDTEADIMKLVFDRSEIDEAAIISAAREHWVKYFGFCRAKPDEERIDAGMPKKRCNNLTESTEAAMIKRRRCKIAKFMEEHDEDLMELDAGDLPSWTAAHSKEVEWQKSKLDARRIDAYRDGHLIAAEVPADAEVALQARRVQDEKNRKDRVAERKRGDKRLTETRLDKVAMRGMTVFFEQAVRSQILTDAADVGLLRVVHNRMEADIIIAVDPANPGQRSSWAAALRGAYLATPDLILKGTSPHIKYVSPLTIERNLFLSPKFIDKHKELTQLLREACGCAGSKWVIFANMDEFNKRFRAAQKTHRHGYYKALITSKESKEICTLRWFGRCLGPVVSGSPRRATATDNG